MLECSLTAAVTHGSVFGYQLLLIPVNTVHINSMGEGFPFHQTQNIKPLLLTQIFIFCQLDLMLEYRPMPARGTCGAAATSRHTPHVTIFAVKFYQNYNSHCFMQLLCRAKLRRYCSLCNRFRAPHRRWLALIIKIFDKTETNNIKILKSRSCLHCPYVCNFKQ